MTAPTTRDAAKGDLAAVARVLARSFDDDPVMGYLFPKGASRPRKLEALFTTESAHAHRHGLVHTTEGSELGGAAIWLAPNHWKVGGLDLFRQLPLLFTMGTALRRSMGVLARMERVHPKEPHWYLAVLGTDPDRQGQGIGSALLAPVLDRCDTEGLPAYLESSKEGNIPFYRRHGFEVTGEIAVEGGPTLWPMWREPRPPDA